MQSLAGTAAQQGSREMTREEISVLSSHRRDNVRKQMEELERYKRNPLLYIFSPRVQVRTRKCKERNYDNGKLKCAECSSAERW